MINFQIYKTHIKPIKPQKPSLIKPVKPAGLGFMIKPGFYANPVIVRVTMGYQFVMNVRIILLYCNRNVNRTNCVSNLNILVGGVIQPLIFNISAHFI